MSTGLRSRTHSIGTKIFVAFAAMGLITGALGVYGLYVLSAAGRIAIDTYDRPLMAVNFARSASLTFALMDKDLLRRRLAPAESGPLDQELGELASSFFDDLKIAEQRALAPDERTTIAEIRDLVGRWDGLRRQPAASNADLDALSKDIVDRFDRLIELIADHSFIERRKAVTAISDFTYKGIAATLAALLLSAGITLLLARRIIRPLSAAVTVADRIALGELQTPIPVGGKDEAGAVLRSMTVMQDNLRDLIERETSQRRSAQARLIDALESSREGIVLVDAEGRIVAANSQIATFFPSLTGAVGPGADFVAAFSMIAPHLEPRDGAAETDVPTADGEYQLADGRWIRFSRSDTRDGGFILFLSDFTDIKEREERYKEAKIQAEAASTAKSAFLANMSHELRTPLNAVIGFSEIITGQLFGPLGNAKYLEYSGSILDSGRHLLDIINSVLDIAKSESSKLHLNPRDIDLRTVIESCVSMMRDQCLRANLDLTVGLSDTPLPVSGEVAKLRQVFLNLLSNAVKFTEPGGSVLLTTRRLDDGSTEVRVRDTGIGMSPADIPVALSPFGQVDTRLARRYEGTGLGLPLSKALIDLHGGTLSIESAPGVGTTVIVTLPNPGTAPSAEERTAPTVVS